MPIDRKHFDQLNTPQSWKSPVSVIAHIDLDAFYAQCLGVHNNIDPSEPLGCRQWQSLIAINYPARKFGLKRGVTVEEARKLCPGIHLPHVATFKKGESHWDFHDAPDPNNYKVSLDHFRRESRKIFAVFKEHFRFVEKAGIDEGFMDLGPEVHREALRRMPEIKDATNDTDSIDLTHDDLIDIGAELVNQVRLDIHEQLKYTCSAGIAPNKQLAKLGSGYNKPFNQTAIHIDQINEFLAHFKITDAWGWGGKLGKEVLAALSINDTIEDQCEYIRNNFTLSDLQKKLKGSVAQSLYSLVRGQHASEVSPRTLIKSMAAVKDFRKLTHLKDWSDIESWLRVFSADLSGRVSDLQDDLGSSVLPKTIVIGHHKGGMQRKQQAFEARNVDIDQLREQIYLQSLALAKSVIKLPCEFLVVEISHIHELPKERLAFQPIASPTKRDKLKKSEETKDSKGTVGAKDTENADDEQEDDLSGEEKLFVDDEKIRCSRCGNYVSHEALQEHDDWHFARDLQAEERAQPVSSATASPPKKRPSPSRSTSQKKKAKPANQKSILEFFK